MPLVVYEISTCEIRRFSSTGCSVGGWAGGPFWIRFWLLRLQDVARHFRFSVHDGWCNCEILESASGSRAAVDFVDPLWLHGVCKAWLRLLDSSPVSVECFDSSTDFCALHSWMHAFFRSKTDCFARLPSKGNRPFQQRLRNQQGHPGAVHLLCRWCFFLCKIGELQIP